MKNVTISVSEQVARWARVYAAKQGKSVSRMVGELLERHMREEEQYDEAMGAFLALAPVPLKEGGGYPCRDELHER